MKHAPVADTLPSLSLRLLRRRGMDVAEVDHAGPVVQLSVDRAGLDEDALALDPRKAVHGPGARA
jgi:hypothetical protein